MAGWIGYILPVGSGSAGKTSPPHMLHAAAAVTRPANPRKGLMLVDLGEDISRSESLTKEQVLDSIC
jgi:hypothetical protein